MVSVAEIQQICIENNIPFFTYRLPDNEQLFFGAQLKPALPITAPSDELRNGFLFHPFQSNRKFPVLFIEKEVSFDGDWCDQQTSILLRNTKLPDTTISRHNPMISKEEYLIRLKLLIESLRSDRVQKVVCSRILNISCNALAHATELFRTLQSYPHAFRFWVHIPGYGSWMGATPETLLIRENNILTTMALAGTRAANDDTPWKEKERYEQQLVANYILQCFQEHQLSQVKQTATQLHVAGPVTHLCTHFFYRNPFTSEQAHQLLQALHPTPAVCGIPLTEAIKAIHECEIHQRGYYSGYLGPIAPNGEFKLFVNLRSMELFDDHLEIHIGGGITADSDPEAEWNETQNKAQTMLSIIKKVIHEQ